jgi:hypothetical protein
VVDADDVVAGGGGVGDGAEPGVDRVQAPGGEGDGGRDVEVRVVQLGDHAAAGQRARQLHQGDQVVHVADHEQGPAQQQEAVAVGHQLAAEVDLVGDAGARVDGEQQAGVALHHDQHLAAPGGLDAVEVEPWLELEVAGERQRAHRGLAGQPAVAAQRDDVQLLVERVGEVGGLGGHHHVVDEGRHAGRDELVAGEVGAGPGVVDKGLAGRAAGDEDPALPVDLDADGGAPGVGRDQHRAAAAAGVAGPHGAGRDRADVQGGATPAGDPLRLEAVGQPDEGGERPCRGGGRCQHHQGEGDEQEDGATAHGMRSFPRDRELSHTEL